MTKVICLFFPLLFLGFGPHRPAPVRKGQDLAIFFAVDNYRHPNLADLQNPVKNATDIAGVLQKRFGFDTIVVRNPTQAQIEQKLNDLKDRYARNLDGQTPSLGQLLVFFSGHGREYYGGGYFLSADSDPLTPNRTGLGYVFLRDLINSINCNHIMVAVDACFSANFDPQKGNRPDREFKRIGELSEVEKTLLNYREYKARLFFTSDAVGDMTPDRSNFARKMLEGLDAFQSPAGFMTSSELFANYIEKASPTPHGGNFGDDDPRSAFLFFYEENAIPPVDTVLEKQIWQEAQTTNILAAYQYYRFRFPYGKFRPLADKRIAELEDYEAWQQAKAANTESAYEKYLADYPSGAYRELAEFALNSPSFPFPVKSLELPVAPTNMVFVEGGTFTMGCTKEQGKDCRENEKPDHQVTISSFYIGKFEVTNKEFCEFLNAIKPDLEGDQFSKDIFYMGKLIYSTKDAWFDKKKIIGQTQVLKTSQIRVYENSFFVIKGFDNYPVTNITWDGANEYCKWLSEKTGKSFRLPTEAEWEYAARGGKFSQGFKYSGSNNLNDVGWYSENSGGESKPVGQKKPNELKIYDMSGNVWEWCSDWYDNTLYYYAASEGARDPKGPKSGLYPVLRGGSWYYNSRHCRLSYRDYYQPSYGFGIDWEKMLIKQRGRLSDLDHYNPESKEMLIGFRLVRDLN